MVALLFFRIYRRAARWADSCAPDPGPFLTLSEFFVKVRTNFKDQAMDYLIPGGQP
jgi:hypothetical protein